MAQKDVQSSIHAKMKKDRHCENSILKVERKVDQVDEKMQFGNKRKE